jgi:ABC-type phosphate transport system substrate-binding protein
MRKIAIALGLALGLLLPAAASSRHATTSLVGAGSSLVAPLVSVWTQPVDRAFGYQLTYSPIGSAAASPRSRAARSTSGHPMHP